MVSVTEQWAQFSIAGPRSRDVLRGRRRSGARPLERGLSVPRGRRGHASAAASRRGCSGSRSRASSPMSSRCRRAYGEAAIRAVMAAGAPVRHRALRHRGAVGAADREGARRRQPSSTARPRRATSGLRRMMSTKKDFIGRAMAERPALLDPDRPMLVGLQAGRPHRAAARRRPFHRRSARRRRPSTTRAT